MTELYPRFALWLHSLTSFNVLAMVAFVMIVTYVAIERSR
jgi:hypothetical protein